MADSALAAWIIHEVYRRIADQGTARTTPPQKTMDQKDGQSTPGRDSHGDNEVPDALTPPPSRVLRRRDAEGKDAVRDKYMFRAPERASSASGAVPRWQTPTASSKARVSTRREASRPSTTPWQFCKPEPSLLSSLPPLPDRLLFRATSAVRTDKGRCQRDQDTSGLQARWLLLLLLCD